MRRKAYLLRPDDSVAVAISDLEPGEQLRIEAEDRAITVAVKEKIPFGHKIAVRNHCTDERVIKYGEDIGYATRKIEKGCWVHTHNIASERGKRKHSRA